jgi:cold shock CspA family protein
VLPAGSIQWEQTLEVGARGIILRELQRPRRAAGGFQRSRSEGDEAIGGKLRRVVATADEGAAPKAEIFEFAERDLVKSKMRLQVGDEVEFNVFVEKRSKRKGATGLKLVKPNPVGRVQGIIVRVEKTFGFIRPAVESEAGESIFFYFSDCLEPDRVPARDDEVEFRLNASDDGKSSATRVCFLPKGTVKLEEAALEECEGVVVDEPDQRDFRESDKRGPPQQAQTSKGTLRVTSGPLSGQVLPFASSKVRDKAGRKPRRLLTGDIVSAKLKVFGGTRATVSLVTITGFSPVGRETGIVSVRTPTQFYCFIECAEREPDQRLFLHLSELADPEVDLQEGHELSFTVLKDGAGKLCATRAEVLPKGSVVFHVDYPGPYAGSVTKVSALGGAGGAPGAGRRWQYGTIRLNSVGAVVPGVQTAEDGSLSAGYLGNCVRDGALLLPGDAVSFSLRYDKRLKKASAVDVAFVSAENNAERARGVVVEVPDHKLRDSLGGSAVGRIMMADRRELVTFKYSAPVEGLNRADGVPYGSNVDFCLLKAEQSGGGAADGKGAAHSRAVPQAVRLRLLGAGEAVQVETVETALLVKGVITRRAGTAAAERGEREQPTVVSGAGKIKATVGGVDVSVPYHKQSVSRDSRLTKGDVVTFHIARATADANIMRAVNINMAPRSGRVSAVTAHGGVIVLAPLAFQTDAEAAAAAAAAAAAVAAAPATIAPATAPVSAPSAAEGAPASAPAPAVAAGDGKEKRERKGGKDAPAAPVEEEVLFFAKDVAGPALQKNDVVQVTRLVGSAAKDIREKRRVAKELR